MKDMREHGISGRRTQQYCGTGGTADAQFDLYPNLHFEVKGVERLSIEKAFAQARRDCGDKIPVVVHKKNRGDWMITMDLFDFVDITNVDK